MAKKPNSEYLKFLASKALRADERGLKKIPKLAPHLFGFQAECVRHHLRVGASGCFLDTGMGKTEVQLEWCQKAIEATNSKAILWTPLAVAGQTKRRADKWGYEARVIRDQSEAGPGINICNYDRRDRIDPSEFDIVSCDEASILKSFTGKTTRGMIDAFKGHRFKLVATATPAPNDHMELGNYAEFLEIMAANEMLSRFFINDTSTASQHWRLKGHATRAFWDWLASFARMAERPSDITGNIVDDVGFALPPFHVVRHRARDSNLDVDFAGLFGALIPSATTMFSIKRQTQKERIRTAIEVIFGCKQDSKSMIVLERNMPLTLHTEQREEKITTAGNVRLTQKTLSTSVSSKGKRRKGAQPLLNGSGIGTDTAGTASQPQIMTKSSPRKREGALSVSQLGDSISTIATPPISSEASYAQNAIGVSESFPTIHSASGLPQNILNGPVNDWWIIWCDTNDEQDALAHELGDAAFSITGSQDTDLKEELHDAWLRGDRKILISKISILGFGMDWSHCHNMLFLGRNFSYEAYYQAVRRCWRFGQRETVTVHLIVAEGETEIGRVIDRKAGDHLAMKLAMREAMQRATGQVEQTKVPYLPTHITRLVPWISAI